MSATTASSSTTSTVDVPQTTTSTPTSPMERGQSPIKSCSPQLPILPLPPAIVSRKGRHRRKQRHRSRMITGYIIYASEVRKDVIKKCPDRDFGDISKIVGLEWKNLPKETKLVYEKRAQEQNERTKANIIQQQQLSSNNQEWHQKPPSLSQEFSIETQSTIHSTVGQEPPPQLPLLVPQESSIVSAPSTPLPSVSSFGSIVAQTPPMASPNHQDIHQPLMRNMSNNIVYKKPATIRLRPRDIGTQTEPIEWIVPPSKHRLRYSDVFVNYLKLHMNIDL